MLTKELPNTFWVESVDNIDTVKSHAQVYVDNPLVGREEKESSTAKHVFNSLITVGYLLEVFIKLWIPSLVCIFTSAWS